MSALLRFFALGFLFLVTVVGFLSWRHREDLSDLSEQIEFQRAFIPMGLRPQDLASFPDSCWITGIKWKNDPRAYCATVSFQMACAAEGVERSLEYLNWLTGYTYGAFLGQDLRYFYLGSHTHPGIEFGAPFLGLKRVYLSAPDREGYVRAIKTQIARGKPVEVGLNVNSLYGHQGFSPHSNLITGYNGPSFFVYETSSSQYVKTVRSTETMGNLRPVDQLIKAVEEMNAEPAVYTFTILERGEKRTDEKAIWRRNGRLLIGRKGERKSGARAIHAAADRVRSGALRPEEGWNLRYMLERGGYSQKDNAAFIRQQDPKALELEKAADLLAESGELLTKAFRLTHSKTGEVLEKDRLADYLDRAAEKEREAGEWLVKYGEK
jgi:hypothetical protein